MKLRVGQLWVDCKSRSPLRILQVESIGDVYVNCRIILTGEEVVVPKIQMPLKSLGWCLFRDPAITSVYMHQYDKRRAA